MWTKLFAIVRRDVGLIVRDGNSLATVVGFYVITIVLFPLGIGPEAETLSLIAPGVLWVAALLATLLSLDRVFRDDFEDGSLELMALMDAPMEGIVMAKAFAHWLTAGLPIVLLSPLGAVFLDLGSQGTSVIILTLLVGTPALSFLGVIGAALTVSLPRGGVLLALIILPFYVPTLIFGAGSVNQALLAQDPSGSIWILAAISLAAIALAPFAAAASLRLALE